MKYLLKKEFIAPIIILIICFLLCVISKKLIIKLFNLKNNEKTGRKRTIVNLLTNVISALFIIISILTILEIYGIDTKTLIASLGVVGIVIGLALQDVLKDFISGVSFIFEGQFSIGDWVSINNFKGEVMPSNIRTTKLKAYTGEVKIISNRNITEIINYTLEPTNLIIDVSVDYDSDIIKVQNVLDELCKKLKEEYKLKNISCLGIQELSNSSINFRLVVETKYVEQFEIDRKIKKDIILTFEENKITIPYNQVVIHNGKRI